jgi:hypothetical protein
MPPSVTVQEQADTLWGAGKPVELLPRQTENETIVSGPQEPLVQSGDM